MKIHVRGQLSKEPFGGYSRSGKLTDITALFFGEFIETKEFQDAYDPNCSEPFKFNPLLPDMSEETKSSIKASMNGIWVLRNYVLEVKESQPFQSEEVMLRIKHAVLCEIGSLKRMKRELEALENLEKLPNARRERIPDSVRLFVWQRDEGKCVRCGSCELLEFDHIIPIAKGGSNTERNLQLLCEACNRSKGTSI